MMIRKPFLVTIVLGLLTLDICHSSSPETEKSEKSHHRQKRLFWITNDGRIALPPGTNLIINPTLSLPFVRYPPYGFLSNISISLPFTIEFDKLGLTDNENPYGALPPLFDRGMKGRQAGMVMADFVASFIKRRFQKRDIQDPPKNAFHGGERALLYGTAEDMISTLGLDGKACLLRAICEVQGHPLSNFGLIGEMLKLFFTASKSPFANLMNEYVEAENHGKVNGECWPYFKNCPKSLFLTSSNKYSQESNGEDFESDSRDDSNGISQDEDGDIKSQRHILNPTM